MNVAVACAGLLLLAMEAPAMAAGSIMNPSSRITALLQGLVKKLEADVKSDENIYERFVCWCNTVKKEKTMSNSAAQSRIDELKAYIADVEAGKVEFTTER